jgi:hypothetical protein
VGFVIDPQIGKWPLPLAFPPYSGTGSIPPVDALPSILFIDMEQRVLHI